MRNALFGEQSSTGRSLSEWRKPGSSRSPSRQGQQQRASPNLPAPLGRGLLRAALRRPGVTGPTPWRGSPPRRLAQERAARLKRWGDRRPHEQPQHLVDAIAPLARASGCFPIAVERTTTTVRTSSAVETDFNAVCSGSRMQTAQRNDGAVQQYQRDSRRGRVAWAGARAVSRSSSPPPRSYMSHRVRTPLRKTVDEDAEMAHSTATIAAARIPDDDFVLSRGVSSQVQRRSASRGSRRPASRGTMSLSHAFLSLESGAFWSLESGVSPWKLEGKAMGPTAPGADRRREPKH